MAGEGQSTVKLLLSLSLLAVLLGGIQADYSIKDCGRGNITFYADEKPTLECEGIGGKHNIYWSTIDTEDNEVRIGDCNTTRHCYGVTNSDYDLTRPSGDKSMLKIQHNIGQKDGQKIKCSQLNNNSYAFCTLDIISYTIPICESGNITLREGEVTTLQCVGMHGGQDMYWSVYDDGGNEVRIGDCLTNRQCTGVTDSDYNLTRPLGEMSELTIQGNYREKSGKTVKCAQKLNQTETLCTLNVIYGPDEAILKSENGTSKTMLTCITDDVSPAANFTWTGVVCDSQAESYTPNVCVFDATTDDDGRLVTCTATNVADSTLNASDSFRIKHIEDLKKVQPFPTAAVAGGAGAVGAVIIVVVIISRRKKKAAEENPVIHVTEEEHNPDRKTYDKLQPASLAVNRDYTELTVSTVSSGLQNQDARQTYERLQPDLAADNRNYTALNVSGVTRGQRSQDTMYYNAALESDYSAGPSYTNVEGVTSTSGTRSDRHGNNIDVPQDEPATDGVYETTELS